MAHFLLFLCQILSNIVSKNRCFVKRIFYSRKIVVYSVKLSLKAVIDGWAIGVTAGMAANLSHSIAYLAKELE